MKTDTIISCSVRTNVKLLSLLEQRQHWLKLYLLKIINTTVIVMNVQCNCYWGKKRKNYFCKGNIEWIFYTNDVVSVNKTWRFWVFSGCVPWGKAFNVYNICFLVTTNWTFCIEQAEQTTVWTTWTARRKFSPFSITLAPKKFCHKKKLNPIVYIGTSNWAVILWLCA